MGYAGGSRNARIDLLRGLCILLVILEHLAQRMPPSAGVLGGLLPGRVLAGIFSHGYEAVFIFFVISGFLITSNSIQRWACLERLELRTFYAQRFARIAPCLVALVLLLCILAGSGVHGYAIDHPEQSLRGATAAALGLCLNWYEGHTAHYLPASWDVLWSLSIEEVFYLGFPLVCLCLRRRWLLVSFLVLLALSLPWTRAAALATNEIWHEKAYLPGMSAIAVGVLAALVAARLRARRWHRVLILAGSAGILAVVFADDILWPWVHEGLLLLLAMSSACLLVAFHVSPRREAPVAGTGWLCSFGRLSYETYLTHVFVVLAVVAIFRTTGLPAQFAVVWFIPAIALVWLLARLVDSALSRPSNRALRKYLGASALAPPAAQ